MSKKRNVTVETAKVVARNARVLRKHVDDLLAISRSDLDGARSEAEAKELVLVVEDDSLMNEFIGECLAQHYRVVSAFNGQDGVQKALANKPSLIISDLIMPRMSGMEMVFELRKNREMSDTPIIVLSAKVDDELRLRLIEGGAQDFIAKPFVIADLLSRVRHWTGSRQRKTV